MHKIVFFLFYSINFTCIDSYYKLILINKLIKHNWVKITSVVMSDILIHICLLIFLVLFLFVIIFFFY
jgi:hypothetical protein